MALLLATVMVARDARAACTTLAETAGWRDPEVKSANGVSISFDAFINVIAASQVVFVGELHDRYDHHLTQLELICRLQAKHPKLAIGMEFFQAPFQAALDEYIDHQTDETSMLRATEYYRRWRYDYRLYQPILAFARAHRLRLLALNVPGEVTRRIAQTGLEELTGPMREQIPAELDRSSVVYRERLQALFDQHPTSGHRKFENFLSAQLVWDEGMAAAAANFIERHEGTRLVVLAGRHHILRDAIPARLGRRVPGLRASVSLLAPSDENTDPQVADFWIAPKPIELAPAGRLGVMVDEVEDAVEVTSVAGDSAAGVAGVLKGDRIERLNSTVITQFADLRLALRNLRVGDTVEATISRGQSNAARIQQVLTITLQ